MSREFLASLPMYHPSSIFKVLQDDDGLITAKSLSNFLQSQGYTRSEIECQILFMKPLPYSDFLRLMTQIRTDNQNYNLRKESYISLSEELRLAIAKDLNVEIEFKKLLKPPLQQFQGTINNVALYFKEHLQFISEKELELIQHFLDPDGSGIIDTKQITLQLQCKQQSIQQFALKQVRDGIREFYDKKSISRVKGKSCHKQISDMNQKDDKFISINSLLLFLVGLLRREIKLNDLRIQLQIHKFNQFEGFKLIDVQNKGFITIEDYDHYLKQPLGTSKYIFRNSKILTQRDFQKLFQQISLTFSCKQSGYTYMIFKEFLLTLQIAPPKVKTTNEFLKEIDFIAKENIINVENLQQYLLNNGFRYSREEIKLLFSTEATIGSNLDLRKLLVNNN